MKNKPLLEIFIATLKIGAFTFGGGYAMIPIMQDEFVKKKGWIDDSDILDIFAVAQSLPGVISLNSSVFIGYRVAGVAGAIAAALGITLPSLVVLSIISIFYVQFRENKYVGAAFQGIRPCVVALMASAALKLWKGSVKDLPAGLIAAAAFLAAVLFGINAVLIIIASGILGVGMWFLKRNRGAVQ